MARIIKSYWDENLGHQVNVYDASKREHKQIVHSKTYLRMKSSEVSKDKKIFDSMEDSLIQEVVRFIKRKEVEEIEKKKEGTQENI